MATRNRRAAHKKVVVTGPEYSLDEEALPVPQVVYRGSKPIYFPFGEMGVGRSFKTHRTLGTLRASIRRYRKGNGEAEFTARALPEGGCRVWRTK